MNVRRAQYREGAGLLATGDGRLFFLSAVDHPCSALLMRAVSDERPLHALEAVVTGGVSDVPPFAYIETLDGIEGVVCGKLQVEVTDNGISVVDGASADPWARLSSSLDATVRVCGDAAGFGDLWIESGVVRASSFSWAPHSQSGTAAALTGSVEFRAPAAVRPTLDLPDNPESAVADSRRARSKRRGRASAGRKSGDDGSAPPVRAVDALVCLECDGLNPPMTARCASCGALLWGANSEVRSVKQPALGAIRLSDERVEFLDADLLIGRNPARFGIQSHQREVVHGIGDQSVSRLHIELILDGWTVKAVNHKQGPGTTVETLLGGSERLPAGTPRKLDHGDTIYFGTVWLRYDERGSAASAGAHAGGGRT